MIGNVPGDRCGKGGRRRARGDAKKENETVRGGAHNGEEKY